MSEKRSSFALACVDIGLLIAVFYFGQAGEYGGALALLGVYLKTPGEV